MRDSLEYLELNNFRVDENELNLIGRCVEQDTHDYRTGTNGLTRACCTCDDNMGHFRYVAQNYIARNVLSYRESKLALGFAELVCRENIPKRDHVLYLVRNLDSYSRFSRNCGNSYTLRGKAKRDILEKAFYGPITPEIPASILQLHPDITVIYSEN